MPRYQSLVRALAGRGGIRMAGMALAGALLVALAAQIDVPMYPVPMSLQTLAVSIVGLTFSPGAAFAALAIYLSLGAAGLPVFAGGEAGLWHLAGPTAGYLFGFVFMAWLTAMLVRAGWRGSFGRYFVAALVPSLLLMVPGVLWLSWASGMTLAEAVATGAAPFLVGKLVKTALAVLVVQAGWRFVARRRMARPPRRPGRSVLPER
ncbi:biotin transporter BioY [Limimaricola pyoseonensis]|uniref:Biotin transporter n=1 Tax=Limimaricola pyoseonensis TaxID=521013 RepID=A0A1G6ZHV7_9RHOB|nr:biotin transporter BioY [Limimaricola pyoseonensis]SDE01847.1 biotin transport system substrate-specific component [Limimaricola pyoseonensis]